MSNHGKYLRFGSESDFVEYLYYVLQSVSLPFSSFPNFSIHWKPEHQSIIIIIIIAAAPQHAHSEIDTSKCHKNKSHNTTFVQLDRPATHFSRLAQNTSESISAVFALGKMDVFCIRLRANQNTKSHFAIVNIQIYSDIFNPQPTLVCPGVCTQRHWNDRRLAIVCAHSVGLGQCCNLTLLHNKSSFQLIFIAPNKWSCRLSEFETMMQWLDYLLIALAHNKSFLVAAIFFTFDCLMDTNIRSVFASN